MWEKTLVTVGLLKVIHGRWSCVPLAFAFYLRRSSLRAAWIRVSGKALVFRTKFEQAVTSIGQIADALPDAPVLVVADSWFGNNGLFKPLRARLGDRAHLLSRLRANAVLHAIAEPGPPRPGRPRKYGRRFGNAAQLAASLRTQAGTYTLHVYGAQREVQAAEQLVMLKSLRRQVRVVWVYRRTQWVALVTTDLELSVEQAGDRQRPDTDSQSRRSRQSPAFLHGRHNHHLDLWRTHAESADSPVCVQEHDRICLCRCPKNTRQADRR